MSSEMLHLEWDNFRDNLVNSIANFKEKQFADVILACEDRQVMTHKLVLAASSPVLQAMLVKYPHPQPLIFLRGVKYVDLKAFLDFIYSGQVELEQERLEDFLQLGKDLQVKGLTKEVEDGDAHSDAPNEAFVTSVGQDRAKVKGITWFPDGFQPNRPKSFSMKANGQNTPGTKSNVRNDVENRVFEDTEIPVTEDDTREKLQMSGNDNVVNICPQGTLQEVLKSLSRGEKRFHSAVTPSTESSVVESLCLIDAEVLGDHFSVVEFPEDSFRESRCDDKETLKLNTGSEQSYPGNLPDFVEELKEGDGKKVTYVCKLCRKSKAQKGVLLKHIESAHFPGTFTHTCKFCAKMVKTKSALDSHLHSCNNRFFQVNNNNNKTKA